MMGSAEETSSDVFEDIWEAAPMVSIGSKGEKIWRLAGEAQSGWRARSFVPVALLV